MRPRNYGPGYAKLIVSTHNYEQQDHFFTVFGVAILLFFYEVAIMALSIYSEL